MQACNGGSATKAARATAKQIFFPTFLNFSKVRPFNKPFFCTRSTGTASTGFEFSTTCKTILFPLYVYTFNYVRLFLFVVFDHKSPF